ncbi:hypothetical protein A3K34_04280 [candidate division WWE3 bacterium RIFOXYC1_FULL_40_10]|uniref:Uncharacterized protein n=1 Tax=candidate division WWE3 bacterium RIFOXYA2_FULL_46_9 TaxID=1802636 RepID=A0A1F4W0L1_UNCKA|nr:MAG: hypothetical protein A3K58_04280 [candidate division WWE3 bacterium RIFOXYB1_FULL_40_22]OGC62059.1 MAG: hypothetical protein A3K37_04280 [candidate division WWE3 bacterium RIFOXYA1_FULL_40_11]OGC62977.1 MAG: hypothetical protein A2264_03805 [candidate division WWE3 bacterium RIFOXYA2_FULL_46_9]OGC64996.1 MAG: hypothetical protein A2326_03085 [candidate division WWE3 bacterium RIFOXYB2_FULL_41_6]OGC66442.1 MAG: hypothetical protein A3K34_04280 [candidate division WWE3 bacterium RIFOXYC1_
MNDRITTLIDIEKPDYERRKFFKYLFSIGIVSLVGFLLNKKSNALSFGSTGVPDPIGIKNFSGSGADYSLTLTTQDTAYQCPASGNVPSKDYILDIYNSSDSSVYWGWSSGIAGTSALRRLISSGGSLNMDLGSGQSIYLVCASADKTIAYGTKERS